MNHLPRIKASYDWFYAHYEREVAALDPSKDGHAVDQLEKKRDIFERGIFVLMFAQFEKEVDRVFQSALAKRGGADAWNDRRGWDLDHLRGERVSFYVRLAMVLDKRNHNFSKIWDAYRIRNDCAHGETDTPIGSISLLEQSLYRWQAMLRD